MCGCGREQCCAAAVCFKKILVKKFHVELAENYPPLPLSEMILADPSVGYANVVTRSEGKQGDEFTPVRSLR